MDPIRPQKMVTLKYSMKSHLQDGTTQDHPERTLTFVYAVEPQVPSLEKAIEGCKAGDRLALSVPAAELYGEHDPGMVVEIPKNGLIRQRLKEGQFYRQMRMGSLVSFKVLEIRQNTVLADFNRPMVGIRVSMNVEILDVRDASEEEVRAAAEAARRRDIGCG